MKKLRYTDEQISFPLKQAETGRPVVNAFTREALAIDVDQAIKSKQVVAAVTRIS